MRSTGRRDVPSRPRPAWPALACLACLCGSAGGPPAAVAQEAEAEGKAGRVYVATGPEELVRGLIAVDPETGTWQQVVPNGMGLARVSPDGRHVAYSKVNRATGEQEVWVAPIGGDGEPTRIGEHAALSSWSGDGRQVVLSEITSRVGPLKFATWRFEADGSHRERLSVPETDIVLDLSPDGHWFLVRSVRAVEDFDRLQAPRLPVFLRRPDGRDERLVVPGSIGPGAEEGGFVTRYHQFSPDGKSIVYVRAAPGAIDLDHPADGDGIWVVGVDGSGRRRVVAPGERGHPFIACWSPDGKRLAVDLIKKGEDEGEFDRTIEIIDLDGKDRRPLPLPPTLRTFSLRDWR